MAKKAKKKTTKKRLPIDTIIVGRSVLETAIGDSRTPQKHKREKSKKRR